MYIVKAVIVVRAVSIGVYALIAFQKLGFKGPNNYLYILINDIYVKNISILDTLTNDYFFIPA